MDPLDLTPTTIISHSSTSFIQTQPGYDYVSSLDFTWSVTGRNMYGRIMKHKTVFSWSKRLEGLGNYIHIKGLKLGIYILPGSVASN